MERKPKIISYIFEIGVKVDNMKKNQRVVLGVLLFGLILLFANQKSVRKMKTKWNEKRHSLGRVKDHVY